MLEIVKEPKPWAANDPINRHLDVLAQRDAWTAQSDKARNSLEAELKRRGFIDFEGTPQHYGLWLIGEHLELRSFALERVTTGGGTLLGLLIKCEGCSYVQVQEPS